MEINNTYDVAVLGGGLTGFTAAVRCAQLGKRTAIIEEFELGGYNSDIVPMHFLHQTVSLIKDCSLAQEKGLEFAGVSLNLEKLTENFQNKLDHLVQILRDALKSNDIDIYIGKATPRSDRSIAILRENYKTRFIQADQIILAGGCIPDVPPQFSAVAGVLTDRNIGLDGFLPKSLLIYGHGASLCECAQIYALLGTKVTVTLDGEELVPGLADNLNESLYSLLEGCQVTIYKNVKVDQLFRDTAYNYHMEAHYRETNEDIHLTSEQVYYTGNQRANLRGLEALNLEIRNGFIETNDLLETSTSGIYAPSGSVKVGGSQSGQALAALIAAEAACQQQTQAYDPHLVPKIVETIPEAASIGYLPREAALKGYDVQNGIFPMSLNDWAVMIEGDEGFVQVISDARYGEILGVYAFGKSAGEMITTAEAVMKLEGTVDNLSEIVYPYPSVTEALGEAALDAIGLSRKKSKS